MWNVGYQSSHNVAVFSTAENNNVHTHSVMKETNKESNCQKTVERMIKARPSCNMWWRQASNPRGGTLRKVPHHDHLPNLKRTPSAYQSQTVADPYHTKPILPWQPLLHSKKKCSLTCFTEHPTHLFHSFPPSHLISSNKEDILTHIAWPCLLHIHSTLEVLPWIIYKIPVSHNKPCIVFPFHKLRQLPYKRFSQSIR